MPCMLLSFWWLSAPLRVTTVTQAFKHHLTTSCLCKPISLCDRLYKRKRNIICTVSCFFVLLCTYTLVSFWFLSVVWTTGWVLILCNLKTDVSIYFRQDFVTGGGSEVWVYRGSRVRSPPVPIVLSVYQRGSLLDSRAMYLSCDTKKFHDNESTHILHNFWTSTHRGGQAASRHPNML